MFAPRSQGRHGRHVGQLIKRIKRILLEVKFTFSKEIGCWKRENIYKRYPYYCRSCCVSKILQKPSFAASPGYGNPTWASTQNRSITYIINIGEYMRHLIKILQSSV